VTSKQDNAQDGITEQQEEITSHLRQGGLVAQEKREFDKKQERKSGKCPGQEQYGRKIHPWVKVRKYAGHPAKRGYQPDHEVQNQQAERQSRDPVSDQGGKPVCAEAA